MFNLNLCYFHFNPCLSLVYCWDFSSKRWCFTHYTGWHRFLGFSLCCHTSLQKTDLNLFSKGWWILTMIHNRMSVFCHQFQISMQVQQLSLMNFLALVSDSDLTVIYSSVRQQKDPSAKAKRSNSLTDTEQVLIELALLLSFHLL